MKMIPFITILSVFLFFACEKQEVEVAEVHLTSGDCGNCIQLNDLQVGQVSLYQKFQGASVYKHEVPGITYLDDTLRLEVIAQSKEEFTLRETISSNSEETWEYQVRVDEEGIAFVNKEALSFSNLFINKSIRSTQLPFQIKEAPKTTMKGWYINSDCDQEPCFYMLEKFTDSFEDLNVYLDYTPLAYDGNGFYILYNEKHFVRTLSMGAWTGEAEGWDLIR